MEARRSYSTERNERVGASGRIAKLALAEYGRQDPAEIEEVWHGLEPPYLPLFAWLDGLSPRPAAGEAPVFRPLMLAHPLEGEDIDRVVGDLEAYSAEWKWDGIRVQIAATAGGVRLYSRTGDEIGVDAADALERASGLELVDQDAHRHAGRAGVAIGHIGDVLAAPKPALQEIVDQEARLVAREMREQLPLEPAGEVGTRLRRSDVEFREVALMLCHGSPAQRRIQLLLKQA